MEKRITKDTKDELTVEYHLSTFVIDIRKEAVRKFGTTKLLMSLQLTENGLGLEITVRPRPSVID